MGIHMSDRPILDWFRETGQTTHYTLANNVPPAHRSDTAAKLRDAKYDI
jgi:hypothetical protein